MAHDDVILDSLRFITFSIVLVHSSTFWYHLSSFCCLVTPPNTCQQLVILLPTVLTLQWISLADKGIQPLLPTSHTKTAAIFLLLHDIQLTYSLLNIPVCLFAIQSTQP